MSRIILSDIARGIIEGAMPYKENYSAEYIKLCEKMNKEIELDHIRRAEVEMAAWNYISF